MYYKIVKNKAVSDLPEMIGTGGSYFSEEEIKTCGANQQRILARFMLKQLICDELLQINNADNFKKINIRKNSFGKPYFEFNAEITMMLNKRKINIEDIAITHTKNRVVVLLVYSHGSAQIIDELEELAG